MDKKTQLKIYGFKEQRQKDYFSLTIPSVAGQLTSSMLNAVKMVADKYARGIVHLTSRQSLKIPFIHVNDIEAVKKFFHDNDVDLSSFNMQWSITACQGSQICKRGLIDTIELADIFNERYRELKLPQKIKLGIAGCPNNCARVKDDDVGIIGCGKNQFIVNFGNYELTKINGADELFESIDTILFTFVHNSKPKESFKNMVERMIFENYADNIKL